MGVGLEVSELGIRLASQHMRFFTAQDMPQVSTTELLCFATARQVPCGCSAPEVVTKRLSCCCRMGSGSSPLGKDTKAPNFLYTASTCLIAETRSLSVLGSRRPVVV